MKDLGTFEIKKFSKVRQLLGELYEVSTKRTSVIGLIEINVTTGRQLIRDYEIKNGFKISFTGWLIKCISHAVSEHKNVHAYRIKKDKIIVYDNVHISTMVERTTPSGKKVPITHVIYSANTKTVQEITDEIREVQERKIEERNQVVEGTPKFYLKLFSITPKFIRKKIMKRRLKDTSFFIENAGTVGVTAIGMFGKNVSGWAIPFTSSTLNIAVGGIKSKPIYLNGQIEEQEFLNLTIQIDHTIVDGAPATRFVSHLVEIIETGFGL
ncbi:hypothetical protein EU534_02185 [Candidatus Heimdallarchaeota archaeon]|nr:MAG: hypothetical protein EU534_02185 [Candidatus Heimdallarchaeota archaeon]